MLNKNKAVVFGLYETGLGVIRSLGSKNIKVVGVDHKKDIGAFSRYGTALICPHPIKEETKFIDWIKTTFKNEKIPAFICNDDFLTIFYLNLPPHPLLVKIFDKYQQYNLAKDIGISVPQTFHFENKEELKELPKKLPFPMIIKGRDVNTWRNKISGNIKGFEVKTTEELIQKAKEILNKGVGILVQEIIIGKDSDHYKYNAYMSATGEIQAEFMLKKIRQYPPHFGVGAAVESCKNDELLEIGRNLFKKLNYTGIGSAEFKIDKKDGKFKLIEINPRYWQQNYLATYCGVNFPHINYTDLMQIKTQNSTDFDTGVKWINKQLDFNSFLFYYRKRELSFWEWRKSYRGRLVFSNFLWNDPLPALYNVGFGIKILKAPFFLAKKLFM